MAVFMLFQGVSRVYKVEPLEQQGFCPLGDTAFGSQICDSLLVVRVVDMARSETKRGPTRAAVLPVVVSVRDTEVTGVLVTVAVAVSDEAGLPVVVEIGAKSSSSHAVSGKAQLPR